MDNAKNCLGPLEQMAGYCPPTTPTPRVTTTSDDDALAQTVELDKLATALAKAQSKIDSAKKDSTNPHFKSRYADLASVWEAIRGPLTENGLSIVQMPSADGAKVSVTTILLHTSGQFIRSRLTMVAADTKPQTVGSCLTYARRYALSAVAGVAPDDDDGNAANGGDGGATKVPGKSMSSAPGTRTWTGGK